MFYILDQNQKLDRSIPNFFLKVLMYKIIFLGMAKNAPN